MQSLLTLGAIPAPWHRAVVMIFRIACPTVIILGALLTLVWIMHKDLGYGE